MLSPRTNVLKCVLIDSHGRPVCADGHTRTNTDSPGRPVCADGHTRIQPTWAKVTRTVHEKGQHAESKDQRADMFTDGQPQTSCVDVLCVLMDTHGRPVCADGHTRTHMNSHGRPVCADGQPQMPVCAGGHPRKSCVY
ncbi:unnamed protein product [Brassica rapa]|uniref:Uncharacterized protein n=1 Tax=Brassica campestris TaxID=3711 RepID=A0A8D9CU73_BRACM|nr:unnamed protein product [Brassica rapa]